MTSLLSSTQEPQTRRRDAKTLQCTQPLAAHVKPEPLPRASSEAAESVGEEGKKHKKTLGDEAASSSSQKQDLPELRTGRGYEPEIEIPGSGFTSRQEATKNEGDVPSLKPSRARQAHRDAVQCKPPLSPSASFASLAVQPAGHSPERLHSNKTADSVSTHVQQWPKRKARGPKLAQDSQDGGRRYNTRQKGVVKKEV
ncbi:hypothetical protein cyc_07400 [Cyclospora cayetanensis]|uniref:Uncharacterized protein n=1 Tax=Cyclospora cayetanensis TaxID=88456 RepID=A0A1D3DAR1_9EIME|nr:hypothetical protein cyc_07400 [Cyclospora cayetanensis]